MAQISNLTSRFVGSKPLMHNKTFVYIEMNLHCLVLHWRLLRNQLHTKKKHVENHIKRLKNIDVTLMIECYTNNSKLFSPEIF